MNFSFIFSIAFSLISFLIGIIFLIIGIIGLKRINSLERNCTEPIFAKITDIQKRNSIGEPTPHITWHPVLDYTIGEQHYSMVSPYGKKESDYQIGQSVKIYYNPKKPNEYIIAGNSSPKSLSTAFTIIGIFLLIICMGIVLFSIFSSVF